MSRSLKKGPHVDPRLMEKVLKMGNQKTIIKTWARHSTISPEMLGLTFGVHNGKEFIPVFVTEEMIGHKLGEFSATTKFSRHGGKMQKGMDQAAEASASAKMATEVKKPAAK